MSITASLPKITVVTPSLNQGAYIEKTIHSVLSQNYPNLEYIIIDGGSTDNSINVIKKYEKYLSYWVSEKDTGQSNAINKGFARSSGELLTWINSDDWYTSGALHVFADAFRCNPHSGMFVGSGQCVDESNKLVYSKAPINPITIETLYNWFQGGFFIQPSSVFSRKAWLSCGPLDESEHMAMDLDLWLKISRAGFQFTIIEALLSEMLIHPNAKTTAFENQMRADGLMVIAKHGGANAMKSNIIEMRQQIERLDRLLSWYKHNYEIVVNNPLVKLIRPIVKRLGGEGKYWQRKEPPWV